MPNAPLVIVNPTAGGGRAARLVPWLRERLASRADARLVVTRRAGEAEAVAGEARSAGVDRIVAVGGDGTVQEVVNGLVDGAVPATVGIVPVGSGNDLARSLGLPRDPAAAWTVAIGRGERAVDLLLATGGSGRRRWFGSAGGIGFDAQVAAAMATRAGWQRGQLGYLLTTLVELRRFSNRRVELTLDGAATAHQVLFVAIANGEYYGGGMRIAPGAAVDDGMFDLCVVGNVSRLTALRQLANLYRGTHVDHPSVAMHRGRSVAIAGDRATLVHLDGEPFGGLPLQVELHPARITVAAPLR
ncbi:MAG TPA: diacylglycerol kinase family protein [Candidatus Limnocylindria bacterium]